MGLKAKRKNINSGGSKLMIIPAGIETGDSSTIAANRLILADVKGIIPESDLLEFLETKIEPEFWNWHKNKKIALNKKEVKP